MNEHNEVKQGWLSLLLKNQATQIVSSEHMYIQGYLNIIKKYTINDLKLNELDSEIVCRLLYDYLYQSAISQAIPNALYIRIELSRIVNVINHIQYRNFEDAMSKVASVYSQMAKTVLDEFSESMRQQLQNIGFLDLLSEFAETINSVNDKSKDLYKIKRGKKGKKLKNWQKIKFYQ